MGRPLDAARGRTLVAKVDDSLLQAFAGQVAAGVYAINGQYVACMGEIERAHASLVGASVRTNPLESPAYYYHERYLLRRKSAYLLRLEKPSGGGRQR